MPTLVLTRPNALLLAICLAMLILLDLPMESDTTAWVLVAKLLYGANLVAIFAIFLLGALRARKVRRAGGRIPGNPKDPGP